MVAAAGLAALLLAGVLVAVAVGSGGNSPAFVPSGPSATVIMPTAAAGVTAPVKVPPFKPAGTALALASSMSLSDQVAQLFLVGIHGQAVSDASQILGSVRWGGVVFDGSTFKDDRQVAALAGAVGGLLRASGAQAPLVAATQEGGPASAFRGLPPQGEAALGAGGDPGAAGTQAKFAAARLRQLGFNMTLAPLADVDNPGGPLTGRLFGTDPQPVARFTASAVTAYRDAHFISATGHFPGSGGASGDPDQSPATVGGSLAALRARDLIPFAAAVATTPVILMSNAAYAAFDGVTPASLLPQAVRLLREGVGFQGVVMSDDLDAARQAGGISIASAALEALNAGDDLLYISRPPGEAQAAYAGVLAAARKSDIERGYVKQAVLRVLSLKVRYGVIAGR